MANESQTTPRPGLSAQPVDTGLQALLRQGWTRVRRAAKHFHIHPEDPEALHDLRVAMRRQRSLFQAFAPVLPKQVAQARALRRLFRQSNKARDHEVSLSLLQGIDTPPEWLIQRWQKKQQRQLGKLQHLPDALQQLSSQNLPIVHTTAQHQLGQVAATGLERQQRPLRQQLLALQTKWDDATLHQLRIRAKKIRYLIEPFARQHRPCARALKQLKLLQDLCGDYHDHQLLVCKLKRLKVKRQDPQQRQQRRQAIHQLRQQQQALRKTIRKMLKQDAQALQNQLNQARLSLL